NRRSGPEVEDRLEGQKSLLRIPAERTVRKIPAATKRASFWHPGGHRESDDVQARHPYGFGLIVDIGECAGGSGAAGRASADGPDEPAGGARAGPDYRLAHPRHRGG